MTNSTSTISSDKLKEELLDDFEENSDLSTDEVTKKHPGAFRTISEVAEEIHVPQHVLRFWETRFKQVQPVKRSGGRRYYRAEDISLLQYISELLYTQGYTIKGVQRLLDEDFSRFNAKNIEEKEEEQDSIENHVVTHTEIVEEENVEQSQEDGNTGINDQISQQSVANTLEVTRLQEENKLLIRSLQSVLIELQELRKIITSEC